MAVTFRTKRNDTKPIQMVLQHKDPQTGVIGAVNLTSATGVRFLMDAVNDAGDIAGSIVAAPAAVLDAINGLVAYEFLAADTAKAGTYQGEFEVTYGTGEVETFPEKGYIKVIVEADLG